MTMVVCCARFLSLLFAAAVLSGCVGPVAFQSTPSPTSTAVRTQTPAAVATRATTDLALPTPTLTPLPPPTPTVAPIPTPTVAPSPTRTQTPVPTTTPTPTLGERALRHVSALSHWIGSRPAGSSQERAAADYVANQLREFGYTVERQTFSFPYFLDRGSTLQLVPTQTREFHPLTMGLSSAGELELPLANAGLGRVADLPRAGLAGRVALIQRGEITFDEKVRNATGAGAAGAIIYNNTQGNFRGRLSNTATIPVLTIAQDEGEFLVRSLSSGPAVVRLSVDAVSENREGQNIIGARPGVRTDTVIFGAHYDSVEAGPGANDNASGTAAMLELARLAQPGPMTLRFIAFAAEELGLYGSRHYVSTLGVQQRQQVKAMFSLDMVGVGNRIRFGGSPELVSLGMAVAAEQRLDARPLEGGAATASDHGSFIAAGMPGVLVEYTIGNDLDPRYHSAQDQVQFVDPAAIENVVRVSQALVDRLAGG